SAFHFAISCRNVIWTAVQFHPLPTIWPAVNRSAELVYRVGPHGRTYRREFGVCAIRCLYDCLAHASSVKNSPPHSGATNSPHTKQSRHCVSRTPGTDTLSASSSDGFIIQPTWFGLT